MHHFRGKLLMGDRTILDPANLYIEYHTHESAAAHAWEGYLLVESENELKSGGTYTLRLADGRAGMLRVDQTSAEESGKFRAKFVGEGPLA
jgi:hypothetical protein